MQERVIAVLKEKIAFLEAQVQETEHWKAEAETWKALAKTHRDTAIGLRRELNETTDAYNDLYDMVEHGST